MGMPRARKGRDHQRPVNGSDQPTPEETAKAAKLINRIAPSDAAYNAYRRRAEKLIGRSNEFSLSPLRAGAITRFELRGSIVFRRAFLVAYTDPARLQAEFPNNDAVTVASLRLDRGSPPPFVLLSAARTASRGRFSDSVLEHEFVHVNQAIRGVLPDAPEGGAEDLVENLLQVTRAEYEANLIQLTRWPEFYFRKVPRHLREKRRLSLDRWCVLRGYTQGLERVVDAAAAGQIEETALMGFIGRLPGALPSGFRRLGFGEELGKEYADNLQAHFLVACQNLARNAPGDGSLLYFALWQRVKSRPGTGIA